VFLAYTLYQHELCMLWLGYPNYFIVSPTCFSRSWAIVKEFSVKQYKTSGSNQLPQM